MAPTLSEIQNDPDFKALSPQEQAYVASQIDVTDDSPGSVSIEPIGLSQGVRDTISPSKGRASDRPILNDIAAVGDAIIAPGSLLSKGVGGGPISSSVTSLQDYAQSGASALRSFADSNDLGGYFDLGPVAAGAEIAAGIPSMSYRDAGTGAMEGVGSVAGMGLGSLAGPLGSVAGFGAGGIGGRILADQMFAGIDGVPAPSMAESVTMGALDTGMNAVMPGGMKGINGIDEGAAVRQAITQNRYENAFNSLVAQMSPSQEEASGVALGLKQNLKESFRELTTKYGYRFSDPKTIAKQLVRDLGDETTDAPGLIQQNLTLAAKAVDNELPVVRFSDPAETGVSLEQSMHDAIENYTSDPSMAFSANVDNARALGRSHVAQIKEKLVDPKDVELLKSAETALGTRKTELEKLKKDLARAAKEQTDREDSKVYQKIAGKIVSVESEIDDLTKKVAQHTLEITNPKVTFEKLWSIRQSLDRDAANAFDSDNPTLKSEVFKIVGNGARTFEDTRAGIVPSGQVFSDLKRQYHLLQDIMPGVRRMFTAIVRDPDVVKKKWQLPKVYERVYNGKPKIVFSGNLADMLPTYETNVAREVTKSLQGIQKSIDSYGYQPPSVTEKALNAIPQLATVGARASLPATITRDVQAYVKREDSLESLKQGMFFETLQDKGLITPEERKSGVNLAQVSMRNPQAFQMAQMEVEGPYSALRDAIEFGDEEEQGMALTNVVKMFPKLFPPPKSGIKGEVEVGGVRKLYDPMDRARYEEALQIRKINGKISATEMARARSRMNATYEVTEFKK